MEAVDERLGMLERRLGRAQGALALTLIFLTGFAVAGFAPATHAAPARQSSVLYLRDIVIEDDHGRPRILLGAPTPNFAGRKRRREVDGIIPLGPNGADRVMISHQENGAKVRAFSWGKRI